MFRGTVQIRDGRDIRWSAPVTRIMFRARDSRGRACRVPESLLAFSRQFVGLRRDLQLEGLRLEIRRHKGLIARRLHRVTERGLAKRLRAVLLCPACGHDLEGLRAEPDGCVICPECRAAWRATEPGCADVLLRPCDRCGYDTRGLRPRTNGQIVCPECGSAWMVNDASSADDPRA